MRSRVVSWAGRGGVALAVVASSWLLGGCTRAAESLVFVNDCPTEIVVKASGNALEEWPLPPGTAHFQLFRSEPTLWIVVGADGESDVPVDMSRWNDQLGLSKRGLVRVEGGGCDGIADIQLAPIDDDVADTLYRQREVG